MTLVQQQNQKQKQAWRIIENLQLLPLLKKYGRVEIVGSLQLLTMVKPDIDLHVLDRNNDLLATAKDFKKQLIKSGLLKGCRIKLLDRRDSGWIKVGIENYYKFRNKWSFDILFTNDRIQFRQEMQELRKFKKLLTPERKLTVLKLKKYYYKKGLCRDSMSYRIYKAVLEGGVKTIGEFRRLDKK